tara:strand:- start:2627 stop:4645 length:2019 start_codon:yes stop_codon:yes gene_type:complete
MEHTNKLITETSPYLLQHAHNPVNWYPWGEEAFAKAKAENKLVIVSIGYSACHWCHVMEHESFEDDSASKVMNDRYICVKVDREERPDVDQIYMNAVQLMTGRGGWPLNCVVLPDGRPIWGGTYFRKDQWIDQINQIADFYQTQPDKALEYANKLTQGIKQSELVSLNTQAPDFTKSQLDGVYSTWEKQFDTVEGGPDRSPKFPIPNNYQFLLRYAHLSENKTALAQVKLTLDKIAYGGIYDHLGGGIARYATDKLWKVPHFEKMLYDNGQIISLYSEAYQKFKDEDYKTLVYGTLEFIERELQSKEGAFYSALDADSDGEEGKFYVWKKEELQTLLGEGFDLFADYYNVNRKGYWEHDNYILLREDDDTALAKKHKITEVELKAKMAVSQKILMAERATRIRPGLDDKTLTSWNGLMLKGYVDAYLTFGEQHFLEVALKNANFILDKQLRKDGGLNHSYKKGRSTINGYLEDYAFVIDAFLKLYEATFDVKWLKEANALMAYSLEHFYDHESGMFFFTSDEDPALIARKMEVNDNVIPASNSAMAINLFLLSHHYDSADFKRMSVKMLNNIIDKVESYPSGYSNWLNLLLSQVYPFYEVAIVGKKAETKSVELHQSYVPNKMLCGSEKESTLPLLANRFSKGQTRIFVCENKVCQMPTEESSEALKLMLKK